MSAGYFYDISIRSNVYFRLLRVKYNNKSHFILAGGMGLGFKDFENKVKSVQESRDEKHRQAVRQSIAAPSPEKEEE